MIIVIGNWFDVLTGKSSNHSFFLEINKGWLEMDFHSLYGDNPTELQQWQWMFRNAETIYVDAETFNKLTEQ